MNNLTPYQQTMLAAWQQHTYAEFVLKDADAALATMTEDPYVLLISYGTGGTGRTGVREFYADRFLPNIPPDFELTSLSQIFGEDRIVEEFVVRFTHTLRMDWMLPGVSATGRGVEFALVGIIQFHAGKVRQRASLLGSGDGALSVGGPGSSGGSGRSRKRGATSQTSVTATAFANATRAEGGQSCKAVEMPPDLRRSRTGAVCANRICSA